jgi:hypothetical protein
MPRGDRESFALPEVLNVETLCSKPQPAATPVPEY